LAGDGLSFLERVAAGHVNPSPGPVAVNGIGGFGLEMRRRAGNHERALAETDVAQHQTLFAL
jgi:hypothetical protein